MKVQYFGDEHDFRKYVLLRALAKRFAIGVCWMLTPDDDRNDGEKRKYLTTGDLCDKAPDVFNLLKSALVDERTGELIKPTVGHLQMVRGLVPGAIGGETLYVPDARQERSKFNCFNKNNLRRANLIFYDPDNGLEVKSCPRGRKDSSKYVFHEELADVYATGKSVIIYQHFPRLRHDKVIEEKREKLSAYLPNTKTWAFETSDVVFLLAAQPQHVEFMNALEPDFQSLISGGLYRAVHKP